jgi:hypothetical protein
MIISMKGKSSPNFLDSKYKTLAKQQAHIIRTRVPLSSQPLTAERLSTYQVVHVNISTACTKASVLVFHGRKVSRTW